MALTRCVVLIFAVANLCFAFHVPSFVGNAKQTQRSTVSMMLQKDLSRRDFIDIASGVLGGIAIVNIPMIAGADEVVEKKVLGPNPTDWGITKDYYTDAAKIVEHMRYCTSMEKGAAGIETTAQNCKREMIDFVSYYRRFPNIAGKLSYSNLYTSINVLSGHYASYGPKFPVPEKRRKRLLQEYNDIEKAIKRQR